MVNSSLVNFKITPIKPIGRNTLETGCCLKTAKVPPTDGKTPLVTSQQLSRDECKAIDYATTEFKSYAQGGWVANSNSCVATAGCCIMDIGQAIALYNWIWGSDTVCVENVSVSNCNNQKSSSIWSYFPIIPLKYDVAGVDVKHSLGNSCSTVDDCHGQLTCLTIDDCRQKLKAKRAE